MGFKAEIGWKRTTDDGQRLELYAHHVGDQWLFYSRERRVGDYKLMSEPTLEDWLSLLDSVRRRIERRLLRPEEEAKVCQQIHQQFPDAVT